MKLRGIAAIIGTLTLAVGPAYAVSGTIDPGSTGDDIEEDIENGWDVPPWFCRRIPQTLVVYTLTGGCVGREATIVATVTSGSGTTNISHTFDYNVFCSGSNTIQHTMQFDAGPVTPIDSGTFDFSLSGGDTVRLVTTEGLAPIDGPAMSRGALLAAAAAVSLGLLWLLRRRRA